MAESDAARAGQINSRRPDCTVLTAGAVRLDEMAEAVIPVDKQGGWTSTDIVRLLRRVAGTRKVGHAGTLDPMATGLLICMTGRCTKRSKHFLEMEKEYVGTMRLGETTPSYDADTTPESVVPAGHITIEGVAAVAAEHVGTVIQRTPPYSAVRVSGERLYHRARRGDREAGPPRVVTISLFEITNKRGDDVVFRLVCSKGTYVRALAHETGQQLGVGAHLTRLRRTRIGPHLVSDALQLKHLQALSRQSPREGRIEGEDHAG